MKHATIPVSDSPKTPVGVYIHVPFCNEKCPYCDFYSLTRSFDRMDAYTQAVIRAIHSYAPLHLSADTLYFGGGTPSLLGAKRLGKIVAAARETFGLEQAEITVEVNPTAQEAWLERLFEELFAAGVNRLSLGLQSANQSELQALGRRHTPEQAWNAVKTAQRIGFSNLSLDLMLAIPYQTKESLLRSIEFCAEANIPHVSYLLKIEPGTSFFAKQDALLPSLPNEEELEALYLLAVEELERRGFDNMKFPILPSGKTASSWKAAITPNTGAGKNTWESAQRLTAFFKGNDIAFLQTWIPFWPANRPSQTETAAAGRNSPCLPCA